MYKIFWSSVRTFAGLRGCLTIRPVIIVEAILVGFLVVSSGHVAAEDTKMARVVELHLSSAQPHSAGRGRSEPAPSENAVTVLSQRRIQGLPPRQRNPELSPQHLVIVGLNAHGQEISRTVMLDPRILRAETAESSGQLTSSEILYRNDVTSSVTIPDDPSAIALKIYKPRWTDTGFALDLLGEATLPEVAHE